MHVVSSTLWWIIFPKKQIDGQERDSVTQDRYFDAKVKEITGKPSESLKILDSLRRVQPESAGVYYTLYEIEKTE